MKISRFIATGLLTLGLPMVAQANLQFDTQDSDLNTPPELGGIVDGIATIDAFDWVQNSFLADGGNLAIFNYAATGGACDTLSCDFTVYTHGTLNSATLAGDPVWSPLLQSGVEITYTLQFTEEVTAVTDAGAEFAVVTDGPIILEIYYDASPDADPISGSGYSDGTLILFGNEVLDSSGFFNITTDLTADPVETERLDQAGSGTDEANDNYCDEAGDCQLTVAGTGSQGNIEIGGLVYDPNFFLTTLAAFGFDFTNISQETPFTTVDPSDCFNGTSNGGVNGANVGDTFAANGCNDAHVDASFETNEAGAIGLVPLTGSVNGFPAIGSYKGEACATALDPTGLSTCVDFVAQTDPNSAFQIVQEVPAPGTLAITGLGLILLGLGRRRSRV